MLGLLLSLASRRRRTASLPLRLGGWKFPIMPPRASTACAEAPICARHCSLPAWLFSPPTPTAVVPLVGTKRQHLFARRSGQCVCRHGDRRTHHRRAVDTMSTPVRNTWLSEAMLQSRSDTAAAGRQPRAHRGAWRCGSWDQNGMVVPTLRTGNAFRGRTALRRDLGFPSARRSRRSRTKSPHGHSPQPCGRRATGSCPRTARRVAVGEAGQQVLRLADLHLDLFARSRKVPSLGLIVTLSLFLRSHMAVSLR